MADHGFDIDIRLKRDGFQLNVAFTAPKGLTVLFGPSGAGKTTILSLITGMLKPDTGHIRIAGQVLFEDKRQINLKIHRRRLGLVPQDMLLFPHLSVLHNLRFGAPKGVTSALFDHIVKLLDLNTLLKRLPAQLSGGEQRRVALGRALLSSPGALLLDEPMAGLDPVRRQRLLPFIERIHHDIHIPILYISHYAEEAVRLADHAIMLAQGRVVATGPAPLIFSTPAAQAHFGPFDLGTVFDAKIIKRLNDLCIVQISGAELAVSASHVNTGDRIRIRILARDVAIALDEPTRTSIQNILPCEISSIEENPSGGNLLRLKFSKESILSATITHQSARILNLKPGQKVYALIKAVAVAESRHPMADTI